MRFCLIESWLFWLRFELQQFFRKSKIPLQAAAHHWCRWWRFSSSYLSHKCQGNVTRLRSVILLVVADEAPSVLIRLPLPQEGLSDRLQLRQLQTHLLQVEGAAVLDLPHGERVHVPESDAHQLPERKKRKGDSSVSLGWFYIVQHALVNKELWSKPQRIN